MRTGRAKVMGEIPSELMGAGGEGVLLSGMPCTERVKDRDVRRGENGGGSFLQLSETFYLYRLAKEDQP
jgi:hypothetical protein